MKPIAKEVAHLLSGCFLGRLSFPCWLWVVRTVKWRREPRLSLSWVLLMTSSWLWSSWCSLISVEEIWSGGSILVLQEQEWWFDGVGSTPEAFANHSLLPSYYILPMRDEKWFSGHLEDTFPKTCTTIAFLGQPAHAVVHIGCPYYPCHVELHSECPTAVVLLSRWHGWGGKSSGCRDYESSKGFWSLQGKLLVRFSILSQISAPNKYTDNATLNIIMQCWDIVVSYKKKCYLDQPSVGVNWLNKNLK